MSREGDMGALIAYRERNKGRERNTARIRMKIAVVRNMNDIKG